MYWFISLFALILSLKQSATFNALPDTTHIAFIKPSKTSAAPKQVQAYKKFYIGFKQHGVDVLTLRINEVTILDSSYVFKYTINSAQNREDGVGQIWPDKARILFKQLNEGRIIHREDGKLIFESVSNDTLNYWKLKEI